MAKNIPPMVSYRYQKCWRVIASFEDDHGSIEHRIGDRKTYRQADAEFNLVTAFSEYPNLGKLILCYIVAESDGIERVYGK